MPGGPLNAGVARPGASAAATRPGRAGVPAAPAAGSSAFDSSPAPAPLRWVWHGKYGSILIEVVAGEVFVNGDRVEPLRP